MGARFFYSAILSMTTAWALAMLAAPTAFSTEGGDYPAPKPVPRMQALPLPYDQVSIQRDGVERTRYHFGETLRRPFLYPIIGPAGRSLTRMGHPHDPVTHSHHNSVWISHHDVDGVNFWADRPQDGRIVHRRIVRFEDEDEFASVTAENEWRSFEGRLILEETRRCAVFPLEGGEWLLIVDMSLSAPGEEPVTLGETPFGMIGVRMAKSIGVHDGGGRIRNSEGGVNEEEIFWKPARWVDYSGRIVGLEEEGIALMDHPANPGHPSVFHVRNDGWMGASLTKDAERVIEPGEPLRLRYGLFIHAGRKAEDAIERVWERFARMPLDILDP